jgi:hypothetical protein
MAEPDEMIPEVEEETVPPRRRLRKAALRFGGALFVVAAVLWTTRERIADSVISSQIQDYGLPATYEIESIGPGSQVLRNIVVGDPTRPDLTIDRAEIGLVAGFGLPRIARLRLERPRLCGSYRNGKLSFGSLDPLIFAKQKEPSRLPDMELLLDDGRALLRTDYGDVGIKAEGKGGLQGGFAGILAATAPKLAGGGCTASGATLFGKVTTAAARLRFAGPLRLAGLDCPDRGVTLDGAGVEIRVRGDEDLAGFDLDSSLRGGPLAAGGSRLAGLGGTIRASWRKDRLTGRYDLSARDLATGGFAVSKLALEGSLRGSEGLSRFEWQGDLTGDGARMGKSRDNALAGWIRSAEASFAAPMLTQIRQALARESKGSRLSASFTLRRKDGKASLVMPNAVLRGGSGANLLNLSRFQFGEGAEGGPFLSGNFATGGSGLPQMAGRMEGRANGFTQLDFRLAEYRAGDGTIAMPQLAVVRQPGGALGFSGRMVASGTLPFGKARNLTVPLNGSWSDRVGLALWTRCTQLGFDRLELANLVLDQRSLQVCPARGGAILRSDSRGVRIAAGVPRLDLSGRLGQTPVKIASGPVGFAMPGVLKARDLELTLDPATRPTRLAIGTVEATVGRELAGRFGSADFLLNVVPLDIRDASGSWRYANGRLSLSAAQFRIEDRQQDDRFQPLIARDAELVLDDNRITAQALLREPKSDHAVTRVTLSHDLGSGAGRADLAVEGLVFDRKLQPDMLSRLALGVIANTYGTVTGSGEIVWDANKVRSSGSFSSEGLDLAAAFGPAQGVSGTVVFTDLVGLTTAPGQRLAVRSINPGIEAHDGSIAFNLSEGQLLSLSDAKWPFLGGTLTMEPVALRVGVAETRRYVIRIEGADAAQFLAQMELGNISASGSFDGVLPLVFDENGGRIEGGRLSSRPPGGNVSYVGELTYKDLSPMANFAFDALRSLDYRQMEVELDGPLTGEIVTKLRFDGIRQGEKAKRNFITKQVAKLPIRFNVNIHAPFYKLITSVKAMYDPAFIRDPRELGLLDSTGKPVDDPVPPDLRMLKPEDLAAPAGNPANTFDESPVQPSESEKLR